MIYPECPHPKRELRKRIYINGSIHYVMQCLTCGHVENPISHARALEMLGDREAEMYDPELQKQFYDSSQKTLF